MPAAAQQGLAGRATAWVYNPELGLEMYILDKGRLPAGLPSSFHLAWWDPTPVLDLSSVPGEHQQAAWEAARDGQLRGLISGCSPKGLGTAGAAVELQLRGPGEALEDGMTNPPLAVEQLVGEGLRVVVRVPIDAADGPLEPAAEGVQGDGSQLVDAPMAREVPYHLTVRWAPARCPPGCCVVKVFQLGANLAKPGIMSLLLTCAGYGGTAEVVAEFMGEEKGMGRTDRVLAYVRYPYGDPALLGLPTQVHFGGQRVTIKVEGGPWGQAGQPPPPPPLPPSPPPTPPPPDGRRQQQGGVPPPPSGAGGEASVLQHPPPPPAPPPAPVAAGGMLGGPGARLTPLQPSASGAMPQPPPAQRAPPTAAGGPQQQPDPQGFREWWEEHGPAWVQEIGIDYGPDRADPGVVRDVLRAVYRAWGRREVSPLPSSMWDAPGWVLLRVAEHFRPRTWQQWLAGDRGACWMAQLAGLAEDPEEDAMRVLLQDFFQAHADNPQVVGGAPLGINHGGYNPGAPDWVVEWVRAYLRQASGAASSQGGSEYGGGRASPERAARQEPPQQPGQGVGRGQRVRRQALLPCDLPPSLASGTGATASGSQHTPQPAQPAPARPTGRGREAGASRGGEGRRT